MSSNKAYSPLTPLSHQAIFWERAVAPDRIPWAYDDRCFAVLRDLYGPMPVVLGKDNLPVLWALSKASGKRPYGEIAELIVKFGEIRIWFENMTQHENEWVRDGTRNGADPD